MANNCSNPQCQVSETGRCLEGFEEIPECPTYNAARVEPAETMSEATPKAVQEPTDDSVNLFGQRTLDAVYTDTFLKKNGGRVIACVGPTNVGKTTLFASLYDLFLEGTVGQWHFGGSATIYPFEQICHSARAPSRRKKAETPRTSASEGLSFYHLALYSDSQPRVDLYLADRAGEVYSKAADSSDECASLTEISRADTILLLVDAESLIDPSTKHLVRRQTLSIVDAFSTESMLNQVTQLIVTLTKFDLALVKGKGDDAIAEHSKIITSTKEMLGPNILVSGEVIAARPESTQVSEPGQGLPSLLNSLILSAPPKRETYIQKPARTNRTFLNPEFAL